MTENEPTVEVGGQRRALWIAIPVAIVAAALLFVLAISDTQTGGSRTGNIVGQPVPLIAGETLDGSTFDVDDHRGSWVVVNFFASWCPPCRAEHDELTEFAERHPAGDVQLVGIAMADTEADVQAFVDELGGGWPLLVSDTTDYVIDFAVTAPPTTFIVAPNGVVSAVFIGQVTADQLDSQIAQLSGAGQ